MEEMMVFDLLDLSALKNRIKLVPPARVAKTSALPPGLKLPQAVLVRIQLAQMLVPLELAPNSTKITFTKIIQFSFILHLPLNFQLLIFLLYFEFRTLNNRIID